MPEPTFKVVLRGDGTMRVFRTNGDDCLKEDMMWLRRLMQADLRRQAIASNPDIAVRREKIQNEKGATGRDDLFEVDGLILELEDERSRQGVTRADVSRAILSAHDNALTHYTRGRARPRLDVLRLWAFVLQQSIMVVPVQLEARVRAMIWECRNDSSDSSDVAVEVEAA